MQNIEGINSTLYEDKIKSLRDAVERYSDLYTAAKEQLHKLEIISSLSNAALSARDFDELLKRISEEAASAFNATGCMIRLIEDNNLKLKASYGVPDELKEDITVSIGEGIAGRAAEEGRTIIARSPEEFGLIAPHISIQTAICTPLKIGDEIIGTFGLSDKKAYAEDGREIIIPFTEDDIFTLESFASTAAIVIDKSILYERAKKQERDAIESKNRIEELRDYLHGLIENSADAIVTSDLEGIVTSWNIGAEKTYGYTKEDVIGRFLPFIPDFLKDVERSYIERIKNGETIKDIETVRRTKGGRLIDMNLTLSPIKDSTGNIIGISGIARDITEKKKIEKDLLRKNDMLSKLLFINSALRGTLDIDKLLRMVLTAVTMGDGLGFNRAMLFLLDEERNILKGAMGVGPSSHEEAWQIWSSLSMGNKDLQHIMEEIESGHMRKDSFMDRLCCGIEISLDEDTILTKSIKEKRAVNVVDVYSEPLADPLLIQQLGTPAYAVVPLISKERALGVLWVDNLFSRRPITYIDMEYLRGFTDQIASAIENARLFELVSEAEQELANIFESISDLVYFNSSDYTIKRVNRAVLEKTGKSADEIIGEKCYKIFHGTTEPWKECPHYKTILTGKPFIGEVEDHHLGGTFLVSASPIFNQSKEILGTVHIVRDITEIKKLRGRVASAERMAALGEMAAKVAHEIRNPLLSIGGFARRLEKRLEGEMREYSKIIVDETSRLEGILSDTLSFVKTTRLEKREIDINELFDNVVNLLEPLIIERGNILIKEVAYPFKLLADSDRLKEALINLLSNANQATEKGHIFLRSYTSAVFEEPDIFGHIPKKEEVIIEIEDTGCGIKEEDINRIFDPFFTTRSTGTGLGLSITKRIVEEHSGKIYVDSKVGIGTKFKIRLPVQ